MPTLVILLSSSNYRPLCFNCCERIVKSQACTLPSEPDKAMICSVSTPPSVLTPPFNIRPWVGWGCDWQWVSRKDRKPLWYSRKRLFVSISSLPCLSSIFSNGMFFVTSIETQVVKRLRLFLLNTVSSIPVLFAVSSETVTLSSLLEHTYFRAFVFSLLCSKLMGFV